MQPPRCRHALAAALVTTLIAGCGSATASTGSSGPEKPDITVAAVAAESATGLYIAQDQGLFAKVGLHVTIKTITSPTVAMPALLHGSMDVISGQLSTFISAQAAGTGSFRMLAAGLSLGPRVEAIAIPAHSPISSPAQLTGTTIAVNAVGGIDQILSDVVLRMYHIRPAQVHYVAVPFQAMGVALAAHRVNAAYLTEPYLTEAEQQNGATPIADPDNGPAANIPIAGYTTTQSWFQRYPRTAAAFAKAIDEGNELAVTKLAIFQKAMEDALHITPQVADVMATGTYPLSVNLVQVQRVADVMFEYGALKKPFDVKAMVK